jgi:two-component sensor histidine kinase
MGMRLSKRLKFVALLVLCCNGLVALAQMPVADAKKLLAQTLAEEDDTLRVQHFLQLATFQIKKPGECKKDLDSAADFINRAVQINRVLRNEKCNGMVALTSSYLNEELNQKETGKKYAECAVNILVKTANDNSLIGESYYQLSKFYPPEDLNNFKNKQTYLSLAAVFFEKAADYQRAFDCHESLGDLLIDRGDDKKGEIEVLLALKISRKIPNPHLEGLYDLLGVVGAINSDYKKAVNYELLAYKAAVQDNNFSTLETICTRLAVILTLTNDFKQAQEYAQKGLTIEEKNNDIDNIYITAENLNGIYLNLNRLNEALSLAKTIAAKYPEPPNRDNKIYLDIAFLNDYIDLHKDGLAKRYLSQALANLKKDYSDVHPKEVVYYLAIRLYINTQQFSLARKYLDLHLGLAEHAKNRKYFARNYKMGFKLDSARHVLHPAMEYLLKWQTLSDSILNERKFKEISNLQLQYETEKKDLEIKLQDQKIQVLNQEETIHFASLKHAILIRNEVIGGSCLLLIILILLIYQNALRKKNERLIIDKNSVMEQLLLEKERLILEKQNLIIAKEHLLEEKELLIQELHHRVKNNLHMISSLLESQSAFLKNEALDAIRKSQHRVQALSLIHQKLYVNDNVTDVLMSVYLREIVSYLRDSFITEENIIFKMDLDPVQLDINQAVPIGLIVNEVITNSIRFAFPKGYEGLIGISLKQKPVNQIVLTLYDNGIGLSEDFSGNETGFLDNSLGMNLIKGLSKSLHGKLTMSSGPGTKIELIFFNQHE